MALSDDQRAMLRLLAQREQGYEDMAALMGVSVEELRARVKDALAQLEGEGEPAPKMPEPPVEGPARGEPRPAAKAPPAAPQSPAASEPPELSATPPPGQVPPSLPSDGKGAATDKGAASGGGSASLSSNGAKVAIAAIVGAVAIVVVVLLVLGGGGGSDSSTSTTTAEDTTTTTAEAGAGGGSAVQEAEEAAAGTQGGKEVTKALLTSEGGGGGKGIAIFGRVKNKLALQIVAEGLEPLGKNEAYAIWVAESPQKMLPLAASPASKEGVIGAQFEVPTELLGYLANETFDEIAITKIASGRLDAALKEATKNKETPSYTGTPVMRGQITGPIIGAAQRLEAEEKETKKP
jgi:hypothetical protein